MRSRFWMLVAVLVLTMGGVAQAQPQQVRGVADGQPGEEDGAGVLTLLHNNDGESSLLPLENAVESGETSIGLPIGGVAAYKTLTDQNRDEAREAGNAVLNVYAGDVFLASAILQCTLPVDSDEPFYDAIAQRQIDYTAHILGNHEFDYSPDFLERFIREFNEDGEAFQPFLSANLDFEPEPGFADLIDDDGVLLPPIDDGRVLGRSAIVTDDGQRFGIVGATTPTLPEISSPRDVGVTEDIESTAEAVQAEIDRLQDDYGVHKIIFASQLQSISVDRELLKLVSGIDIAVAGGGNELLLNENLNEDDQKLPGEQSEVEGTYPLIETDAAGRDVLIVTTAGNYKYVGRLDVEFDDEGEIEEVLSGTSYPRRVIPESEVATQLGLEDAVEPDAGIVETVDEPVQACLDEFAETTVATSEVVLDVSRDAVRGRESNGGNLVADSFLAAYDRYAEENDLPEAGDDNPVIAVQNGGGIRQNAGDVIPTDGNVPGPVTRLNTLDLLPFSNFVTVVQDVTPDDLKTIFERSAATLPEAGGQFLQIAGIRVVYNPDNEEGDRVVALALDDGTPIVAEGAVAEGAPTVTVVTNSFTADGGDDYPTFAENENQQNLLGTNDALISYEEALVEYLQQDLEGVISADDERYQPDGEGRIIFGDDGSVILTAEGESSGAASSGDNGSDDGDNGSDDEPDSLPNTGGMSSPVVLLTALGAAAVGGGALVRRVRR